MEDMEWYENGSKEMGDTRMEKNMVLLWNFPKMKKTLEGSFKNDQKNGQFMGIFS